MLKINSALPKLSALDDTNTILRFYLVVYDLNNYDDDDVRDLGAQAACRILAATSNSNATEHLLPLVAGSQLAARISRQFNTTAYLANFAIGRLTENTYRDGMIPSVAKKLETAQRQDVALFAEEKQNLFVDSAREARLWSRVLVHLSRKAFSKAMLHDFTQWTMEGLDVLVAKAVQEHDGSLGWTRNSEVFVLGFRVISAAEVLLKLRLRSSKGTVRGTEIRTKLVRLLEAGIKSEIHPLWLEQIEKVVQRSLLVGVERLGAAVVGLSTRLA